MVLVHALVYGDTIPSDLLKPLASSILATNASCISIPCSYVCRIYLYLVPTYVGMCCSWARILGTTYWALDYTNNLAHPLRNMYLLCTLGCWCCHIITSLVLMVYCRVIFSVVVSFIVFTFSPNQFKHLLCLPAF